ncbi:hypothetical protein NT6N_03380 [Oceaniferula spumae]|uniref:RRM domain-containing protein n=1 Tax=Oceaniferula spumae TaxID=2979115 RepID=A0AAT9FH17_9BACT
MSQENNTKPRNEGGQRRQGGQNRNRNRNRNRSGGNQNRNRQGGGGQGGNRPQGQKKQGGPQGRQSGGGPRRRQPKPMPLTFWEKILKFVGLYKEPTRPPRRQAADKPAGKAAAGKAAPKAKSNTRDTRKKGAAKRTPNKAKGPIPAKAVDGEFPVETPRLYLGNLSYDATEHDLEDLFKGIGTVRKVEIVYNRHTHRSKGYGFLEMLNVEEAKRAVEVLHDQPFMGRVLVVNGANSKPKNSDDKPRRPKADKPAAEKAPETPESNPEPAE